MWYTFAIVVCITLLPLLYVFWKTRNISFRYKWNKKNSDNVFQFSDPRNLPVSDFLLEQGETEIKSNNEKCFMRNVQHVIPSPSPTWCVGKKINVREIAELFDQRKTKFPETGLLYRSSMFKNGWGNTENYPRTVETADRGVTCQWPNSDYH